MATNKDQRLQKFGSTPFQLTMTLPRRDLASFGRESDVDDTSNRNFNDGRGVAGIEDNDAAYRVEGKSAMT